MPNYYGKQAYGIPSKHHLGFKRFYYFFFFLILLVDDLRVK